ncbi:hypothetical protein [Streptomyces sp. NBC_00443]|uniref:hypothetical protein n=1 Tax=Streptomyces sp. NBC_00443 TaxID=2975743 RepID=UPI002E1A9EF2
MITSAPVTSGAPGAGPVMATAALTVRPGSTDATVCSTLSTAPPDADRNPMVTV